jgi:glucose/arabinose dehydrogenase
MTHDVRIKHLALVILALTLIGLGPGLVAQQQQQQQTPPAAATVDPAQALAESATPLPDGPLVFDSSVRAASGRLVKGPKFRVVITKGLSRPFALAFLPGGDMLITERAGRLRIIRNGVLDPQPIAGMPEVLDRSLRGLNDIALHPRYAENGLIYFTYYKPQPGSTELATAVLARARFDGRALSDVRDLFTTENFVSGPSAARIAFARDGKLYMSIGIPIPLRGRARARVATHTDAQDPASYFGKILRLNDDGSAPADNPFVGRPGYKPEIYAFGIRNALGLAIHPETGELWENENGPQGGDEINIIKAGSNYGWPTISLGRSYTGTVTGDSGPTSDASSMPGMELPYLFWSPSVSLSGMAFYTSDRIPEWKGSVFVGALVGSYLTRIVMNQDGLPIRRDGLLRELKQRIRDVRLGPDGNLYLLTDESNGALCGSSLPKRGDSPRPGDPNRQMIPGRG